MGVDHQVQLQFGGPGIVAVDIEDLSALHWDGEQLWLAADEFPRFERLTESPAGASYRDHRSFQIGDFVDLPEGAAKEVDVEGVDRQGDYLWLVGSHSRTRTRVKSNEVGDNALADLASVKDHPNRHVLIRIALSPEGTQMIPARSATTATGETLTSAILTADITTALGSDEHFKPFVGIPSKDNGLDVEGLVAFDDRVLIGLRGPVLRGWAAIIAVTPMTAVADPRKLALDAPPYRKHFLDMNGLGVRDLCRDGDDVLVLAGPTMILDGPVRIYRWHDAAHAQDAGVVGADQISLVAELPFSEGADHAEGLTRIPMQNGSVGLLVVYDSPAPARLALGDGILLADVISI